ncbi:MAG: AI-2E family transporter [Bacteroidota bacterium]
MIDQDRFQKGFLILLLVAISIAFFALISGFMISLLLAAIFSGVVYPLFKRLDKLFKGRRGLASGLTLLFVIVVVLVPLAVLGSIVAAEALEVSQVVRPWVEDRLQQRSEIDAWLEQLPFIEYIRPYQDQIMVKLGEFAGNIGNFLFNGLAAATSGTATFFFQFFIMLYAMFFFLLNGQQTLKKIMYFMPLSSEDEGLMLERFVSVTRATIKGTLVIGAIQGGLAGLGFGVAGIPSATFWGTIMAVLSIVPALGTAIVWIPGVIYLFAIGNAGAAIGLGIWCALVVGSADNFLRPWLVGKDTKMSDLMVLLGTLGGIVLFGIVGVIIGPIIAALFVTIWDIYGVAFKDVLPPVTGFDEEEEFSAVIAPEIDEPESEEAPATPDDTDADEEA